MFRNTNQHSSTFQFEPKVFQNFKSTASPLPQPKSYTPLRSRLLQGSNLNSTPIASKFPQRTQSPLLNRILSKENVPMANNQLGKSPSKQFNLTKPRLNDSQETFIPKSPTNGYQPSVSPSNNWKLTSQYQSTPGGTKPAPRIMISKNSSGDEENILQSKGLQQFNKKNSIQSPSPLLSGLINKRNPGKSTNFSRPNTEQYDESGSMNDSKFQFSSNAFSKFKSNTSFAQRQSEDIMCRNNDNKKAKYQVLNSEDSDEENEVYYYCAKCAIHVIQQGFKVQEIEQSAPTPNSKYSAKYDSAPSCPEAEQLLEQFKQTYNQILLKQNKISSIIQNNNHNYQSDLDRVDSYYSSMIEAIENLRVKDREVIISHRNKSEKTVRNLSKRLEEVASEIFTINNQLETKPDIVLHMKDTFYERLEEYQSMLTEPELISQKEMNIDHYQLQDKYQGFMDNFHNHFGVTISVTKVQESRQAISFSFEKIRPNDKKICPMQEYIPEEEDRIVSEDEEIQVTKQPFRTLFPDESEAESNQYQMKEGRFNSEVEITENEDNGSEEEIPCGIEDEDDILLSSCNEEQQIGHSPSFKNI